MLLDVLVGDGSGLGGSIVGRGRRVSRGAGESLGRGPLVGGVGAGDVVGTCVGKGFGSGRWVPVGAGAPC